MKRYTDRILYRKQGYILLRYQSSLKLAALGLFIVIAGSLPTPSVSQSAPPTPDTSAPAPVPTIKDLKVLFGGKHPDIATNWVRGGKPADWDFEDGLMIASKTGAIDTVDKYTDFQLHLEFRIPFMPEAKGQGRGNSGVFLQGRYEIQILDSFGISDPGSGDCGAIYSIAAPLVNACKAPLQWQTYDIYYRAPRLDPQTHALAEPPRATVIHNGILVQNQVTIPSTTHQAKAKPGEPAPQRTLPKGFETPGPISLQWHGARVAFRNIWIVPLALQGAQHY